MCWGKKQLTKSNLATLFTWLSRPLPLKMMNLLRAEDCYPFRLLCHFRSGTSRAQPPRSGHTKICACHSLTIVGLVCSSPAPRDFSSIGHQFVPSHKVYKDSRWLFSFVWRIILLCHGFHFGTELEACRELWTDAQTPNLRGSSPGDFGGWNGDVKMEEYPSRSYYWSPQHRIPRDQNIKVDLII